MEHLQDFYPIIYDDSKLIQIQLLRNIREFWQDNKDFWFSHKPIDSWPMEPYKIYENSLENNIRLLLHYDQIYRHPNPKILDSNKSHAFRFASHLALKIIHTPEQFASASESEKVFILLALRHNQSLLLKELALKKILQMAEENPSPLLLRFLNATIWDIHQFKHKQGYTPESKKEFSKEIKTPWEGLLQKPDINPDFNPNPIKQRLLKEFSSIISTNPSPTIAVSISGGVDSMVAADIAKQVCDTHNKQLILLHINYNNRDCCNQECDLIRDFAQKLHVPLYIRKITEIRRIRQTQLRTLYEDITRKIRFSFYSYFKCPVILGHNLDDCFENVFQNLSKQIHFDNLFGMRPISEEQGVQILRPMLSIYKKDIYLYADHTGIPHLYDSTPSWSKRGQMRDKLIPGIQSFDSQILPGLQEFIKRSIFLEQQWYSSFQEYCSNIQKQQQQAQQQQQYQKEYQIPRNQFFEANYQALNFWVSLWYQLIKEKQKEQSRPSNKSFQNLIQQLNTRAHICGLNQQWKVLIKRDYLILQEIQ